MAARLPLLLLLVLFAIACDDGSHDAGPDADADRADADGDTDADVDASDVELIAVLPAELPPGEVPFPIILRTSDGRPLSGDVAVSLDGEALPNTTLYRGCGSLQAAVVDAGDVDLHAALGPVTLDRTVPVVARPRRELSGELSGADLLWDSSSDVVVVDTVVVPAGMTLEVGSGTRVLAAAGQNIEVQGTLQVSGRLDDPVLFTRDGPSAWGGIRLLAGATGDLLHALIIAGGSDSDHHFGHSGSQPVVLADTAELNVVGGGAIDNEGKGYSSAGAVVTLRDVVVSRCDTGGEHRSSRVTVEGGHVLELPDADGSADDDDNDGIYLDGVLIDGEAQQSVIRDTVFAVGEDDAIDHNGALVLVERVWIRGFAHEGIAASTGYGVTVRDSVIVDCGQGIEAGYGAPNVLVEHCLLAGNGVGLRFGDSYETVSEGQLTATHTVVVDSRDHNVFNHVDVLGGPQPDAVDISCSMVNSTDWDDRGDNVAGTASWTDDGCVEASVGLASACGGEGLGPRCPSL